MTPIRLSNFLYYYKSTVKGNPVKIVRSKFFEPIWFDHRNVPHKQLSCVQHFAIDNPIEFKRKSTFIQYF